MDVVAVVSNHPDLEAEVTAFGVPYHHIPVTPDGKAQAEERERIYATFNGGKTFIGFMGTLFQTAKALAEANDPLAERMQAEDELTEEIDY